MGDVKQQQSQSMTPFFIIWIGQAFSLVGSQVVQFALVWWLTTETGSATVLATASLAALLPQIVLGPVAGTLVDRWNRRAVMIVADGGIALATLWLAYLFWAGQVQFWHVYVIMGIRSLGGAFHWPAMQASTSLMVPERHLARVAGLNQTMQGALNIVGPALGALLLELLHELHWVVLVDVGTAIPAILPLFFVHVPQPQRSTEAAANGEKPSVWADFRAGLRYVWSWPGLMAVIGIAMVLNLLLLPASSLMPLLVFEHFEGEAAQLALVESTLGAGVFLGGLLLGVWGGFRRKMYTSLLGVVLLGLGGFMVGLAPAALFGLAVAGTFVMGFMSSMTNGPLLAVLQTTVAPDMQGRVFTLVNSGATAMAPMGLAVAGPLADAIGVQAWFIGGGVACVVMGVGALFVPAIMNIEQNRNGRVVEAAPSAG